ncbi:MAG: hypothetical protein QOD70_1136 [Frankiales bacterium]|nr:hypothetical protein [Frankiales bacterium]MDX6266396.1 hypothetical protein [Frankiales bacterium]
MKRALPALVGVVLLLSGCSGSSTPSATGTGQPTVATAPTASQTPCPARPGKPFQWPAAMPKDLPKPPGATYVSATTSADKVTIVRLTSSMSLQQSVLFVLGQVQKAGFTLGRGDAEPAEADAPFGRGEIRGIYKMLGRDNCSTDWLVATAKVSFGNMSPVLPTASRGPSSSPLPFG